MRVGFYNNDLVTVSIKDEQGCIHEVKCDTENDSGFSGFIVTPTPYFKISFKCTNRPFYNVKSLLYSIAKEMEIEIEDGYINEVRDYKDDLEHILIYSSEKGDPLIKKVCEIFKVPYEDVPKDMNLALTIF